MMQVDDEKNGNDIKRTVKAFRLFGDLGTINIFLTSSSIHC